MDGVTIGPEHATSGDVENYYTPEEVAALLKLNEQTVRKYLRDGSLRGFIVGRVWRVSQSAIDEWVHGLEERSKQASAPAPRKKPAKAKGKTRK